MPSEHRDVPVAEVPINGSCKLVISVDHSRGRIHVREWFCRHGNWRPGKESVDFPAALTRPLRSAIDAAGKSARGDARAAAEAQFKTAEGR